MALSTVRTQFKTFVSERKRKREENREVANERTLVAPNTLRRPWGRIIYWIVFTILILSTTITLGPIYWLFTGALKSSFEIAQSPPTFWPANPQPANLSQGWQILNVSLYLGNSLILALGAIILQIAVSATAAFALSKLRPFGKSIIQFWLFCTLMVPPVSYMIPQFVNISDLPLIHLSISNSWTGVWLPEAANAFNILVLKSFFDSIPNELTDAARLDGANAWQIFIRIILPLSRPALAVVSILTVVASWKDFLWPMLVLAEDQIQPIVINLYHQSGEHSNLPFIYLIVGLTFASIPPIILFLIFQRQIIRGLNLSGIKG